MEATLSAQSLFSRIDFWVNLLSMFSTALTGVFTIFGLILGFLVWKQNEMRKVAEKEMEKINDISEEMENLYKLHLELIGKDKEMLIAARELMLGVVKKSKEIDQLVAGMQKAGREATEARGGIKRIRTEMERDVKSLATVSRMIPGEGQPPQTLRELVRKITSESYSPEAVRLAQELMRKKAGKR